MGSAKKYWGRLCMRPRLNNRSVTYCAVEAAYAACGTVKVNCIFFTVGLSLQSSL